MRFMLNKHKDGVNTAAAAQNHRSWARITAPASDSLLLVRIGPISRGLVLVVWTQRDEETTRIISARWANQHEHGLYQVYRNSML